MQMAVIEHARNVMGHLEANSTEMDEQCKAPVISIMEDQKAITEIGGTMRLGAWDCELSEGSLAYKAYNKNTISERHRHRYGHAGRTCEKKSIQDSHVTTLGRQEQSLLEM